MKLPGGHCLQAGMNSPPELASNGHTEDVSDTKANVPRTGSVGKVGNQPGRGLGQYARDLWCDANKGVRNVFSIVLPGPDIPTRRPTR